MSQKRVFIGDYLILHCHIPHFLRGKKPVVNAKALIELFCVVQDHQSRYDFELILAVDVASTP